MIFKISSSNIHIQKIVENFYQENRLKFISDQNNQNYLFEIKINSSENKIYISSDHSKKFEIVTPFYYNKLIEIIEKIFLEFEINIGNLIYSPYRQELYNEQDTLYINDIHNNILINLVLSKNGLNKDILYKILWDKDKDVNMTKLDTHLTNLKNLVKNKFSCSFNFSTHKNLLRIN